jgi:hypothetical protein
MSSRFQSIFLGAVVVALIGTVFTVVLQNQQSQILGAISCCVIPTIGALIAVWHYTSTNELTLKAGQGAMLGFWAALLGFLLSYVLTVIISYVGVVPSPFDVEAQLELAQERMMEQGMSGDQMDQAEEFTRKFFFVFHIAGFVIYALIGAIGGAIGANIFKKGTASDETEAVEA